MAKRTKKQRKNPPKSVDFDGFLCLGVEIDRNKERGSFLGRGVHFFGQGFIFGVRGSTLIFLAFSVD